MVAAYLGIGGKPKPEEQDLSELFQLFGQQPPHKGAT